PHSLSRSHGDRRDLHSFPTRRSSDLPTLRERDPPPARVRGGAAAGERERVRGRARGGVGPHLRAAAVGGGELMALVSHATREITDRKSTRLNSSHVKISYAVFCLKKK